MTRLALVTGASGGLGAAVALELSTQGYELALQFRSGVERIRMLSRSMGEAPLPVYADMADPASVDRLFQSLDTCQAKLDTVVHCAGTTLEQLLARTTEEQFERIVRINLSGTFHLIQRAAERMLEGGGHIILVSSRAALKGVTGLSAYAASKSGILGLAAAASTELATSGIRVNTVLPGFLMTEMGRNASEAARARARTEHRLHSLGDPAEVARFIGWLAGTCNVTGQVFNIDGRPL